MSRNFPSEEERAAGAKQSPSNPNVQCMGFRSDGMPCRHKVLPPDDFCFRHKELPVTKEQLTIWLVNMAVPACHALASCLDSPDESIRLKAANSILDRLGVRAKTIIQIENASPENLAHLSDDELLDRAQAMVRAFEDRVARQPDIITTAVTTPATTVSQAQEGTSRAADGTPVAPGTTTPATPQDASDGPGTRQKGTV
jgi:hypothetical protein